MKKLKDVVSGLNRLNEGYEDYAYLLTTMEEPSHELKESLIEVLHPLPTSDVIIEHKTIDFSRKTQKEPLMTFEKFLEDKYHN